MSILAWIVLGLIAGVIANWIFPGRAQGGILAAMVLGIVGAVVGGFLAGALTGVNPVSGPFDLTSIIVSVVGALIVLFVWNSLATRRA